MGIQADVDEQYQLFAAVEDAFAWELRVSDDLSVLGVRHSWARRSGYPDLETPSETPQYRAVRRYWRSHLSCAPRRRARYRNLPLNP